MTLASLGNNIPRYFIERFRGEASLGYFSAMAYLLVVGNVVVSAMGQSASPRLSKYYIAGNSLAFRRLLLRFLGLAALLGLAGIAAVNLIGREVLTLLYRPDYAQHLDVFAWIALASAITFVNAILGYGMTSAHFFKIQTPIFIGVVLAMTGACFVLVPAYGLVGAAQAMVIASSVQGLTSLAVNIWIITHAPKSSASAGL
jgi:O-antigen/teichoic acid export membrane protein